MKDYYAILEVSPTASQETIKEQYHFLIQAWHPDKFSNPSQKAKAEEKSKEINAAYSALKNPQKRAQYDSERSGHSSLYREEQRRRQTEEQRQRNQAEETRRRADSERQKREKADKDKHRGENEQAKRNQSKQTPAEVNRNFQNPIRVMIVDDSEIMRTAINKIISQYPDIKVVGEASNGVEAIEQFGKLIPDVVTMDTHMPNIDGLTATGEICKRYTNAKIIIFSLHPKDLYERRAIHSGAKEYIEMNPPLIPELIDAIRRVVGRGTP